MTFNYYRELERENQLKKLEPVRRRAFKNLSRMRKVRINDRTEILMTTISTDETE